jgi:glycosyltransferase involved in cell wall biosynthesis
MACPLRNRSVRRSTRVGYVTQDDTFPAGLTVRDVLLAALATVTDLPWRCVCVGTLNRDPGFVDRLGRQARADRIDDRVHFTGPRKGADLDAAIAAADVLVLASRAETYGMVVTEALARGIPVLTTAVDGLPEALGRTPDGDRPGLLVPPDDAAALAGALNALLADPGRAAAMGGRGRERAIADFSWPAIAAQTVALYSELAG